MLMKKLTSALAGVSMAAATAVAVTPAANAQANVTDDTRTVTFTCQGTDVGSVAASPTTFDVSYPEEVAPGEIFTVTVQPGQMRNNARAMNRVTFDYALPTNATILGLNLAGGQQGLSGTAPSVVRVTADDKTTDANGSVARIWGGNSARFGSSSSNTGTGGLSVAANTNFRLPALQVQLRAPAVVGAEVSIGLPGADLTGFTAASTDFQWVKARTNSFGTTNAVPNECTSNADSDAAELTTTTVGDLDPVLLDTTTALSSDIDLIGPNQPVVFTAQVTTELGALASIANGEVVFRDAVTDEVLGTATPNANGVATLNYTYDRLTQGQPDETRQVIAEFAGVSGDLNESTSTPLTVTNTAAPTASSDVTFGITAQLGTETDTEVPVTVVATITQPTGLQVPEQLIQIYRNGTLLDVPVTRPAANQIAWTDTVPRQLRTTTHTYRAEFGDALVDYRQWNGADPIPVTVTVNGTNPSLDPPIVPGTGSLGALTGSLGSLTGS